MNKNIKMKNKRKINNTLVYTISVLIIVVITLIAGIFPKAFGMYAQAFMIGLQIGLVGYSLSLSFILDVFLIFLAFLDMVDLNLVRMKKNRIFHAILDWHVIFNRSWRRYSLLGCCRTFNVISITLPGKIADHSEESARVAMGYTFFHWGISQWSIFAISGLIVAYFQFRKQRNGLISTAMEPVFGELINVLSGILLIY